MYKNKIKNLKKEKICIPRPANRFVMTAADVVRAVRTRLSRNNIILLYTRPACPDNDDDQTHSSIALTIYRRAPIMTHMSSTIGGRVALIGTSVINMVGCTLIDENGGRQTVV